MEDLAAKIEELEKRLKDKEIVIDALRQEITSLKSKLRSPGMEDSGEGLNAAPSSSEPLPSAPEQEKTVGAEGPLSEMFELPEGSPVGDEERDEEIESLVSTADDQEGLARAQIEGQTAPSEPGEEAEGSLPTEDFPSLEEESGKGRRTAFWAALPIVVIALAAAWYYLISPAYFSPAPTGSSSEPFVPASGGGESSDAELDARIAMVLSEAEKLYARGDYKGSRKAITDAGLEPSPEGKEILSACRIMGEPSVIMTGSPDRSWIRGLADLLRSDAKWRFRQMAARRLGGITDPRSIDALSTSLLNDNDWGVRCEAADSLGKLGGTAAKNSLEKSYRTDMENIVRIASAQAIARLQRAGTIPGQSRSTQ